MARCATCAPSFSWVRVSHGGARGRTQAADLEIALPAPQLLAHGLQLLQLVRVQVAIRGEVAREAAPPCLECLLLSRTLQLRLSNAGHAAQVVEPALLPQRLLLRAVALLLQSEALTVQAGLQVVVHALHLQVLGLQLLVLGTDGAQVLRCTHARAAAGSEASKSSTMKRRWHGTLICGDNSAFFAFSAWLISITMRLISSSVLPLTSSVTALVALTFSSCACNGASTALAAMEVGR